MAILERADVEKHALAHLDPPLDRRRSHMRQQDHARHLSQARIDPGAAFVDVESGPGECAFALTRMLRDVFTITAVGFIRRNRRAFIR